MKNFEVILTEAAVVTDALNRGKLLSWLLGGFVALSLLLNLVLGYALLHVYPIKEFLWTSDARAVCAAIPLSEPNISAARVKDFAAGTAVTLWSFDYQNWKRTIDTVLSANFTREGRAAYMNELQSLGIMKRVVDDKYVVTAISDGEPIIIEEGRSAGRYFWKIQVPIRVFYRTNVDVRPENRVFEFTLRRVDPSPANTNGIAVDAVASKQRMETR
ncbi:DotI/IcmL family type IV secretion protein [Mycobacterium sp. KBS0706]|uniref:DotI/IcmL family type IV secretion protein n=1 Tax=Mycobacterium sp. KBS0706 TaxID=2578109 RepID=UPI00163DB42D|nr:DotI/IcmL family type IV secretion protein [Mycobacterium sp. KBS0706]